MASHASAAIIAIMNTFWPSPVKPVLSAPPAMRKALWSLLSYVFSIPKILRTYFRYNRKLLSRLSRCAYETVKEMMQAVMEDNTVTPGMIVAIQTFGSSDIHWHPHLHCLVTNGCFD